MGSDLGDTYRADTAQGDTLSAIRVPWPPSATAAGFFACIWLAGF